VGHDGATCHAPFILASNEVNQTMAIKYEVMATPVLIKNLQGLIDFHTANPRAPIHPSDLGLIAAALTLLKLERGQ
jgi:hypothetical protein